MTFTVSHKQMIWRVRLWSMYKLKCEQHIRKWLAPMTVLFDLVLKSANTFASHYIVCIERMDAVCRCACACACACTCTSERISVSWLVCDVDYVLFFAVSKHFERFHFEESKNLAHSSSNKSKCNLKVKRKLKLN